ncbi:MAG: hypothetical protein WA990_02620 [Rubrobacteraceae bacterium]
MTLSKYLAEVVKKEADAEEWPEDFFENVLGAWEGGIKRPPQGVYEEREDISDNNGLDS